MSLCGNDDKYCKKTFYFDMMEEITDKEYNAVTDAQMRKKTLTFSFLQIDLH